MAKTNKQRNKQWLSLVTPPFVQVDEEDEEQMDLSEPDDDEDDSAEYDRETPTVYPSLRARSVPPTNKYVDRAVSRQTTPSPIDNQQESKRPGIAPVINPTTNVVSSGRQSTGKPSNIRQVPFNTKAELNPLLSGNVDTSAFAKVALSNTDPYADDIEDSPISSGERNQAIQDVGAGKKTPETVLAETLAKANPQPNSIWKRLLYGAIESVAESKATDLGGLLGAAIGGAGARAIPQVDVAKQKETIKTQALKDYQINKTAADAEANREAKQANIKLQQDRLAEQKERNRLLNKASLTRERRAQANQLLDNLSKLPKDDPDRQRLAQQLKDEYGVTISSRLGEKAEPAQKRVKLYDAEAKQYYWADEQGTPLLDKQGKRMIAQPGKTDDVSVAEAETQVAPINEGALMNQAINEARKQFSKDRSKKNDIANLSDAQILADPDYSPWVRERKSNLVAETKANRSQEVNKVRAGKKQETKPSTTSRQSTQSFDARSYLRQ